MGGAGLLTPPPNPRHRQDRRCREDWPRGGALPNSESQSLRGRFPRIGTPSASAPMGSRGEPASPDFRIGGKANGADGAGRGTEQIGGGDSPPPLGAIGGSKEPPIDGNGAQRGEGRFENSGPRTRISKQLIGGNADELQPREGNGGKRLGEQLSPSRRSSIPAPIGPRGRWGAGDNRLPRFLNRGKRRCRPRRRAGKEGNPRRGVPSAS